MMFGFMNNVSMSEVQQAKEDTSDKPKFCSMCGSRFENDNQNFCPNCGNKDQDKMNVARRTCGYIGSQFWNQGRTQEIRDRVLHL